MGQPVLRSVCKTEIHGKLCVRVEWNAVPGAQYCVMRKTAGSSYEKIATVTAKSVDGAYVDNKAKSGAEYTYTGYRQLEKNKKVQTSAYDPEGITTITAKSAMQADSANTQAETSWQRTFGVDGYAIFRKTKRSDKVWTEVARVDAGTDRYTDVYQYTFGEKEKSKLISERYLDPSKYCVTYTVKAYKEVNGKISYSDFYADGDFTLEAPTIISASQKDDVVMLKWGASANAEQDIIYMAKPSGRALHWVKSQNSQCDFLQRGDCKAGGKERLYILYGAVNTVLKYLAEANTERAAKGKAAIKIVFVDLFYSSKGYGSSAENDDRFKAKNNLGYTLEDYQRSLDALADKYKAMGMKIYRFETDQIITAENISIATSDNLHMTKFTYSQIGNHLADYLIENRIPS